MPIRLGDIRFLNSWPVTYALRVGKIKANVQVITGTPAELNRRLLTGELDASAVSSALYLRHPEELVPIPGFCIRSDRGVNSVLLIGNSPLEQLNHQTIGVSNQGATTPILLKVLLGTRRIRPKLEVTALRYPEILERYTAALLIGDEALAASREAQGLHVWDLGEAWTQWTRLPAVYALWVIRRSVVAQHPELLKEMEKALKVSCTWGREHQRELIAAMRKVFPWEADFLQRYLDGISYEFDAKAWRGLRHFARQAEAIRELSKGTTKRMGRWSTVIATPPSLLLRAGSGAKQSLLEIASSSS